jgi:hypothetical protein
MAGGAEGKVLGVWRPRGLHGKGRLGAPAAGKARRGSSCGSGARGLVAMGARVERGGLGGPTAGKGRCGSSYGGRGTSGGARAAWNLHVVVTLGFSPVRGLGGKWKCVRSIGRETGSQLAVQRLEKFHVMRRVPTTNEI